MHVCSTWTISIWGSGWNHHDMRRKWVKKPGSGQVGRSRFFLLSCFLSVSLSGLKFFEKSWRILKITATDLLSLTICCRFQVLCSLPAPGLDAHKNLNFLCAKKYLGHDSPDVPTHLSTKLVLATPENFCCNCCCAHSMSNEANCECGGFETRFRGFQ